MLMVCGSEKREHWNPECTPSSSDEPKLKIQNGSVGMEFTTVRRELKSKIGHLARTGPVRSLRSDVLEGHEDGPQQDRELEGRLSSQRATTSSLLTHTASKHSPSGNSHTPHSNVTMARIVLILALLVAAASAFVTPASHAGEY
jgi:hypothetical protein